MRKVKNKLLCPLLVHHAAGYSGKVPQDPGSQVHQVGQTTVPLQITQSMDASEIRPKKTVMSCL